MDADLDEATRPDVDRTKTQDRRVRRIADGVFLKRAGMTSLNQCEE